MGRGHGHGRGSPQNMNSSVYPPEVCECGNRTFYRTAVISVTTKEFKCQACGAKYRKERGKKPRRIA